MGNVIAVEILKLKQRKWLLISGVFLMLYLLCILNEALDVRYQARPQDFRFLLVQPFLFILLIHAIVLGIFGIYLFSSEYQVGTIGQLKIVSTSMLQFVIAKISVITLFSILLMSGVMVELVIVGIIFGYKVTVLNMLVSFGFLMLIAITLPLALTPVFFMGAICKGNTIISISSLFLYLSITVLPSMGIVKIESDIMEYIYPFGSAVMLHKEYLYRTISATDLGWVESTANIPLCALSLIVFSIVFIVLSVNSLNRTS